MYVPDLTAFSYQRSTKNWLYKPGSQLFELTLSGDENSASAEAYQILSSVSRRLDELAKLGSDYIYSICTLKLNNKDTKHHFAGASVVYRRNVLSLYVHFAFESEERGFWSVEFLDSADGDWVPVMFMREEW